MLIIVAKLSIWDACMCPGYSFETSKTTPIFIFPNFEDTSTDCVSVEFYQLEI